MTTRRAAIVAPMRTPVGTFGGSLRDVPVEDLAATAIKAVLDRTGIDPALIKLRVIMPGGTVTAGNASQQNDAAAACLVVAEDRLGPLGLEPLGFLAGWAAAGCDPATMGIGPVPAVERLFYRTGLGFSAMDLIELNEAFAVQVLAVLAAASGA